MIERKYAIKYLKKLHEPLGTIVETSAPQLAGFIRKNLLKHPVEKRERMAKAVHVALHNAVFIGAEVKPLIASYFSEKDPKNTPVFKKIMREFSSSKTKK